MHTKAILQKFNINGPCNLRFELTNALIPVGAMLTVIGRFDITTGEGATTGR